MGITMIRQDFKSNRKKERAAKQWSSFMPRRDVLVTNITTEKRR
jgi:hypothetical protein